MDVLPSLNPLLKLYPATSQHDGQPQWTVFHPVKNQYYKIGWAEYECLSRMHKYETADDLIAAVNDETTLKIDQNDLEDVVKFLAMNGLLEGKLGQNIKDEDKSWWEKAMHGYLYFTIPVLKPDAFLQKTSHIVRPLLSKNFHYIMMMLLTVGVFMTLPRLDEFFASFTQIFTLEGMILSAVILTTIKIIHEFAHGYVASINGVSVPHMGVAFIVLYPIFYTEATGAWRLTDRRARMDIGLAGVRFEIYLAAVALILWHFVTPGLPQMMCFTIVTISLLGSLLINLNPLMRFDGYYVLSDYLNIENLHAVALDYARHHMRKFMLGLGDEKPHDYKDAMEGKLTLFGYAIMVYRFFLFLGIAVLVYAVFMKPLGLIAMVFELVWFIGLPIWREVKIWWERRGEFMNNKRFYISSLIAVGVLVFLILPIGATYQFPAVMHARDYQVVYAPVSTRVQSINVDNGDMVTEGDVLMVLESDQLKRDIAKAEANLRSLENLKRRDQTNVELYRERRGGIDVDIETAKGRLDNLRAQQDDLQGMAKISGTVTDINNNMMVGMTIMANDIIMRVVKPQDMIVTAYVPERLVDKFKQGDAVKFRPSYALGNTTDGQIEKIDLVAVEEIDHKGLASVFGGDIAIQQTEQGTLKPINTLHKLTIKIEGKSDIKDQTIIYGHAVTTSHRRSILWDVIPQWFMTARNELSLN